MRASWHKAGRERQKVHIVAESLSYDLIRLWFGPCGLLRWWFPSGCGLDHVISSDGGFSRLGSPLIVISTLGSHQLVGNWYANWFDFCRRPHRELQVPDQIVEGTLVNALDGLTIWP